jgi:hypothetical protein
MNEELCGRALWLTATEGVELMTTKVSAMAALAERIKALPSDGVDRETLIAGLNRFAALKALHPMMRDGACFVTRGVRGARRYFSTVADRDAWKAAQQPQRRVRVQTVDGLRERLRAGGLAGVSRPDLVGDLAHRAFDYALAELIRGGEVFAYGCGPTRRYFRLQAWCDAYKAERMAAFKRSQARAQAAYQRRVIAAKPKPAPKPPKPSKVKPDRALRLAENPRWTPPQPKPARPVIIPAGLVPTVLRGFTGDRWGVSAAPSVISGAACRPWAAAAAGARG